MKYTIDDCSLIRKTDILEKNVLKKMVPFQTKRIFFMKEVPENETRGSHAHEKCHQFLIALNGSFTVILFDGFNYKKVILDNPNCGLHIPPGIWATEVDFKPHTICLVFASDTYLEDDYIRDLSTYKKTYGRGCSNT